MEKRNYLKIVWMLGFLAFASVSCWATAESLHLLLPTWPTALCWIVTIGFFIIASLGTKLIVDSLNQNIYLEKRGLRLCGGILLVLVFWLICSMPTNTHTFFYRTIINDQVTNDISTTRGYLEQIKNNTKNKNQADLKIQALTSDISSLMADLEAEIRNEANPGFGPKATECLNKLATKLGEVKIEPLTYTGTSRQDREKLCEAYREKISLIINRKTNEIKSNIANPDPDKLKDAMTSYENLGLVEKYIQNGQIDLNDPNDINDQVCAKLNKGYNSIKNSANLVNFTTKGEEELYTAEKPLTRVKRLLSVFDVWTDFLKGKYAGHGFAFWIVISILVDIAAFIFFDLAFKKEDF